VCVCVCVCALSMLLVVGWVSGGAAAVLLSEKRFRGVHQGIMQPLKSLQDTAAGAVVTD
jgi:hypothetical protein